jgi:hypothetical protein
MPEMRPKERNRSFDPEMDLGAGRDPLQLKFPCRECTPRANCQDVRCQSSVELDLETLAKRLGWGHGAMHDDLLGLFVCSRCQREGRPRAKVGFTCVPDYDGIQRKKNGR